MATIAESTISDVISELVQELLRDIGIDEPPVDAIRVARGLGIEVRLNRQQSSRGRIVESNGLVTITVRPEPRKERHHWTVAHEVGEYLIPRMMDRWPADLAPMDATAREWFANRFATHLLVPTEWFADDCDRLDHDLIALKLLYRTVSYEVLATRLLDVRPGSIVTIYDKGRLTRRLGNLPYRVAAPTEIECDCRLQAAVSGQVSRRIDDAMTVRAWPIHEDGWKREILLTELACME